MYILTDKWLKKCKLDRDPCKNDGYIGAKCTCICSPGTSGENCEKVNAEYYGNILFHFFLFATNLKKIRHLYLICH